jgi:hypothetical protein
MLRCTTHNVSGTKFIARIYMLSFKDRAKPKQKKMKNWLVLRDKLAENNNNGKNRRTQESSKKRLRLIHSTINT